MNATWMLIAGVWIIGFIFPELLVACGKARAVPLGMNIAIASALALIAASFT